MPPRMTPGELEVGALVTILEVKPLISEELQGPEGTLQKRLSFGHQIMKGVPMEIKALSLPYVIADIQGQNTVLDTRTVQFMEVSKEYAEAAKGTPTPAYTANPKKALQKYRREGNTP